MNIDNKDGFATSYKIRVRDHLETYWLSYFDGWEITNADNGEVILTSDVIDQAGLHGVLARIRDLNLTLISVELIEENQNRSSR